MQKFIIITLTLFFSCKKDLIIPPKIPLDNSTSLVGTEGRYNAFGSVFQVGNKLFMSYRSGTEHLRNGRVEYAWYDGKWSSPNIIATTDLDYRDVRGGVIGNRIILFTSLYDNGFLSMGYFLSTDLTGTSWSGYTTLPLPPNVTSYISYGSLIHSDDGYYQPAYGFDDNSYTVWLWKIKGLDISTVIIYQGNIPITETAVESLGSGKFIAIGRRNDNNVLMQITSTDGGNTWNAPQVTSMGSVNASPACVPEIRYMSGLLYCFYMNRATNQMMIAKSKPEEVFNSPLAWRGVNYTHNKNLGYPSMCLLPGYKDRLMITWEEETTPNIVYIKCRQEGFEGY